MPVIQPDATPSDTGVKPGEPLPDAPAAIIAAPVGESASGHLHDALSPRGFTLLMFVDAIGDPKRTGALLGAPGVGGVPLELVLVGSERGLAAVEAAGRTRRLINSDGALAKQFAANDFPVYLVRPDEHVAARLPDPDLAAVNAALEVAIGKRPASASSAAAASVPAPPAASQAAQAGNGGLGEEGLERVFEAISQGVDAAGETDTPRFFGPPRPAARRGGRQCRARPRARGRGTGAECLKPSSIR